MRPHPSRSYREARLPPREYWGRKEGGRGDRRGAGLPEGANSPSGRTQGREDTGGRAPRGPGSPPLPQERGRETPPPENSGAPPGTGPKGHAKGKGSPAPPPGKRVFFSCTKQGIQGQGQDGAPGAENTSAPAGKGWGTQRTGQPTADAAREARPGGDSTMNEDNVTRKTMATPPPSPALDDTLGACARPPPHPLPRRRPPRR